MKNTVITSDFLMILLPISFLIVIMFGIGTCKNAIFIKKYISIFSKILLVLDYSCISFLICVEFGSWEGMQG